MGRLIPLLSLIPFLTIAEAPSVSEFDLLNALANQGKVQEAINGYLALLKRPDLGDSAERILYELGRLHTMIGRDDLAIHYFQRAIDEFPKGKYVGEAMFGLGACYERMKEYGKAVELYKGMISRGDIPDFQRYNAIVRASYLFLSLMSYEEAIRIVEEGIGKGIYVPFLKSHLAYIYDRAGRYEEAIKVYRDMFLSGSYGADGDWILDGIYDFHKRRGTLKDEFEAIRSEIAKDPRDKFKRILLAELYVRDGNIQQAIVEYSSAARELGDDPYILSSLAKLYLAVGDLNNAEDICKRLISSYPSDRTAKEILGEILLKKGETMKALDLWRDAFKGIPDSGRKLGALLLQKGFLSLAASEYEKALSSNPYDPSLQLQLSKLLKGLGRHEDALELARKVAALPPNPVNEDMRAEATALVGKILCAMGDIEGGRKELLGLVERFPSSKWATEAIGILSFILSNGGYKEEPLKLFFSAQEMEERGDLKGAISGYEEITKRFPRSPIADDVLLAMARIYLRMGNWFQAVFLCGELIARFPGSPLCPHAYMIMGEAYEGMGSIKDAEGSYRKILELYPESYLCGEAKARVDRIERGNP
jgi:tetratricopeptide (TPR) repeat protein